MKDNRSYLNISTQATLDHRNKQILTQNLALLRIRKQQQPVSVVSFLISSW